MHAWCYHCRPTADLSSTLDSIHSSIRGQLFGRHQRRLLKKKLPAFFVYSSNTVTVGQTRMYSVREQRNKLKESLSGFIQEKQGKPKQYLHTPQQWVIVKLRACMKIDALVLGYFFVEYHKKVVRSLPVKPYQQKPDKPLNFLMLTEQMKNTQEV